jgi:5'-deoxynucleotidase YfbR-like HD superfamily hydrolase
MPFFMTLASGRDFYFSRPAPEMVSLRDIAHHLSRLNRWRENIEWPSYSVAQHSMLVAQTCRLPQSRPYALLHDAPEMITGDNITPWKGFLLSLGTDLVAYEHRVLKEAIYPAFGLPPPTPEINADVHNADQAALATEFRDVVAGRGSFQPKAKPLSTRIRFMTQPMVEERFRLALEGALRPFGKVA